jgi:uncharacterized protein YlxP (DUF503 family)
MLLQIHIPTSQSLKDKRQVVKSIQARLQNQFGVAVAEVGQLDVWQLADLGVTCVGNEVRHVDEVLDSVVAFVDDTRPDLQTSVIAREVDSYF